MTWQHKPRPSPEFTREELERIVSLCGSEPSLKGIRLKAEESLSVHREWGCLLEQARIREEERRLENIRSEERFQNEAVWTIFQYASQE